MRSPVTGKLLPISKESLREKSSALRKKWYALQHRETQLWLSSSGEGFVENRKHGWRGTREQLDELMMRGGDALTCRHVDVTALIRGTAAGYLLNK